MISLRGLVACAAGPTSTASVAHDLYGYTGDAPRLDITIRGVRHLGHSLRQQDRLLHSENVLNLDVIHVTVEPFDSLDLQALDRALAVTRGIYAQVGLGVGRVAHSALGPQDAERYEVITSRREAKSLRRKFRGPHDDALDVFVVKRFDNDEFSGIARLNTPCNKDLFVSDGCVVGLSPALTQLGYLLAHEVGHCLGLKHVPVFIGDLPQFPGAPGLPGLPGAPQGQINAANFFNVMWPFGGHDKPELSDGQGDEMRAHCFVRPGC